MHHTWDGVSTREILKQISLRCPNTRVIVFTARELDLEELIQCVRAGVVDYWEINKQTPDYMLGRISSVCADQDATLARLQLAGGPTVTLLDEVGRLTAEQRAGDLRIRELEDQVEELASVEHKENALEHRRILRSVVYIIVFSGSLMALTLLGKLESLFAVGFEGCLALFILFLDGRLTSALLKWGGATLDVRTQDRAGKPKKERAIL